MNSKKKTSGKNGVRVPKNHNLKNYSLTGRKDNSHASYHASTKLKSRYKEIAGKSVDTESNTGVQIESASVFCCSSKKQETKPAKILMKKILALEIDDK